MLKVKNATNDTYDQRRMMGESLQAMKVLEDKLSPESFTNWMKEALDRFMGEGATNEEQTMLTLQYKQRKPGDPYQRSISITNGPKNEPYIAYFTKEACAAIGMKEKDSAPIAQEVEAMVKDIIKQAYPGDTKGDIHIEAHAEDTTLQFVISAADKVLTLTKDISKQ